MTPAIIDKKGQLDSEASKIGTDAFKQCNNRNHFLAIHKRLTNFNSAALQLLKMIGNEKSTPPGDNLKSHLSNNMLEKVAATNNLVIRAFTLIQEELSQEEKASNMASIVQQLDVIADFSQQPEEHINLKTGLSRIALALSTAYHELAKATFWGPNLEKAIEFITLSIKWLQLVPADSTFEDHFQGYKDRVKYDKPQKEKYLQGKRSMMLFTLCMKKDELHNAADHLKNAVKNSPWSDNLYHEATPLLEKFIAKNLYRDAYKLVVELITACKRHDINLFTPENQTLHNQTLEELKKFLKQIKSSLIEEQRKHVENIKFTKIIFRFEDNFELKIIAPAIIQLSQKDLQDLNIAATYFTVKKNVVVFANAFIHSPINVGNYLSAINTLVEEKIAQINGQSNLTKTMITSTRIVASSDQGGQPSGQPNDTKTVKDQLRSKNS